MTWEVLLVIALMWPWWFAGATQIGTCCCTSPPPDCCFPCEEYASAGEKWPCVWSVTRSSDFTSSTGGHVFNEIALLINAAGVSDACLWSGVGGPGAGVIAHLFYNVGASAWDLEYSNVSPSSFCARYRLSAASWSYCSANVLAVETCNSGPFGCLQDLASCPATITLTPQAVGARPTCDCKTIADCPLLSLPDDLSATINDIGAGNSCFATPQSITISWDGTLWDSGAVTMNGCGGTRTVRVTLDTAGAIRLWCDGVEFSLGSTTVISCDEVLFEIRRESVVAQPGNCCSSGNCALRVTVTL